MNSDEKCLDCEFDKEDNTKSNSDDSDCKSEYNMDYSDLHHLIGNVLSNLRRIVK